MELTRSADLSSIAERLKRLRTRIHLESVSGISASDKEAFLEFCQEQEMSDDAKQNHPSNWLSTWPAWKDNHPWGSNVSSGIYDD